MSILPLDSALYRALLGDAELSALMDERAEIAAMLRVEIALAKAQARLGMIPQEAADTIAATLTDVEIAPEQLAAGVGRDGVVAPALVAALRTHLPAETAPWLHWGATSQDIADTGLILRLKDVVATLDGRITGLMQTLKELSREHRDTLCLSRTRMQAAAPTLFGLRVTQWFVPLITLRGRLRELKPDLLVVQLGGAAGNLAAFGNAGLHLIIGLADELGLGRALPWQVDRTRLGEFAGFLATLANALGKMGADLALMAQNEVGEVSFAGAGGSSTLPQKHNPVKAEVLQALARHAAGLAGGVLGAGLHVNERDGASWTQEWLTLPQLVMTVGAATLRAQEMIEATRPDAAHMGANLEATNGLVLAEAATFALAGHMSRVEAGDLVKQAVAASLATSRHFCDCLAELTSAPLDWDDLRSARTTLLPARQLIDQRIAEAETALRSG